MGIMYNICDNCGYDIVCCDGCGGRVRGFGGCNCDNCNFIGFGDRIDLGDHDDCNCNIPILPPYWRADCTRTLSSRNDNLSERIAKLEEQVEELEEGIGTVRNTEEEKFKRIMGMGLLPNTEYPENRSDLLPLSSEFSSNFGKLPPLMVPIIKKIEEPISRAEFEELKGRMDKIEENILSITKMVRSNILRENIPKPKSKKYKPPKKEAKLKNAMLAEDKPR
jgi:hypothetical protein